MMTADQIYEAIARNLRDFGYWGVTAAQVRDTHEWMKGDRKADMPHGVISMFAKSQIEQHIDKFPAEIGRCPASKLLQH